MFKTVFSIVGVYAILDVIGVIPTSCSFLRRPKKKPCLCSDSPTAIDPYTATADTGLGFIGSQVPAFNAAIANRQRSKARSN
tara:strand:+ start:1433 stop:1678 length:246 start_codon:yes stop_codon:yes gene_type:complete